MRSSNGRIDRRALIKSALALAWSNFAYGCRVREARDGVRNVRLSTDPFGLGVASGEPRADGFIVWTRLLDVAAPSVEVTYEIAEDDAFKRIVRSARVTADAQSAHTVHVAVRGLAPGCDYWYRFQCSDATSAVGHARTIPTTPTRLRAALASCQHWEHGYFSAYQDVVQQAPDVLFHVGDYIYEYSYGAGPDVRAFGAGMPRTLEEYRARHALYRSDRQLQQAHAAVPFVVVWDDHEVQNDYAGENGVLDTDPVVFAAVRAAAYQAYFEHMPLDARVWDASHSSARLYRRFDWPGLASFHVLDTRQYRDVQPCSAAHERKGHALISCDEARAQHRNMLGARQERWLLDGLASTSARWTFLVQQTLFAPMRLAHGAIWSDFWDAYDASRERIVAALAAQDTNSVILGGDLHSFWWNDVHRDVRDPASAHVATELLTSCLAARNGPRELFARVLDENAHVRYLNNDCSGYVLLDIHADAVEVDFRAVASISDPASAVTSLKRFSIPNRAWL